jgi:phosphonate transport system substrate-binding protein
MLLKNHTLRFASFLAPNMLPVYQFIAGYAAKKLGLATELFTGASFNQFATGEADVGFICGLPYVKLARLSPAPVELLAAPILAEPVRLAPVRKGSRFGGRPVYFSDVIAKRGSPYRSFSDLRGCSWSYNDPDSQSGYGITRYWLARMGAARNFFGRVIEAGFHQRSIQMVRAGEVDASAIDCQVLAIEMRDQPELAEQLEVIDSLGPSTIQPVVVSSRLPGDLKADLRSVFVEMGSDPAAREPLAYGFIERFAPVTDEDYDDIRQMEAFADAAGVRL